MRTVIHRLTIRTEKPHSTPRLFGRQSANNLRDKLFSLLQATVIHPAITFIGHGFQKGNKNYNFRYASIGRLTVADTLIFSFALYHTAYLILDHIEKHGHRMGMDTEQSLLTG